MANWQVISLDTATPQLRAPGTGDGYSFNSGATQLGVWTTTGLGIGTSSPAAKLHVVGDSLSNTFKLIANTTVSGSDATIFRPADNTMAFSTNGAERMRLDASGRLLVGGTSAVVGSANGSIEVQNANTILMGLTSFTAASSGPNLFFCKSRGATVGTNTIVQSGDTVGAFVFRGANGTGYDDAAYIIGSVDGTPGASADMPGRLTFWTTPDGSASPAERMRIANGGAVGVNSTSPAGLAQLAIRWDATATTVNNGVGVGIRTNTATADVAYITFYNDTGAGIGSVTRVAATNAVAYNTTSDIRLKENVAAADDAGSVIDAIEIVKHDWKDGGHVRYGVIAQDLRTVAPEAVSPGDDGDEIKRAWGVDYSKLVPMLVKEIQSLRARVAQLEAK